MSALGLFINTDTLLAGTRLDQETWTDPRRSSQITTVEKSVKPVLFHPANAHRGLLFYNKYKGLVWRKYDGGVNSL